MAGVIQVALGVPAGDDHGLADSLVVDGAGPDLIVACFRQNDGGAPTLPGESLPFEIEPGVGPLDLEVSMRRYEILMCGEKNFVD